MPLEVHLIIAFICGGIAAAIAAGKGRSPVGWFFGGFFLGLIGIVIVACIANEKEAQARAQRAGQERRRLREKLRQETMKNEAFRQHAVSRLDAHDKRMGTRTRNTRKLRGGTTRRKRLAEGKENRPARRPLAAQARRGRGASPEAVSHWYYEINGETMGPISEMDLAQLLRSKQIPFSTLLCQEDQENWQPANQVPEFQALSNS